MQAVAQSAKCFLAILNRPILVLHTVGKPASRLQALGGERKVPELSRTLECHVL